jgi:hypothetical protein
VTSVTLPKALPLDSIMTGKSFLNGVANGKRDILDWLLSSLGRLGAEYCVIGGLGVNAYVEPVVSLDLDVVVAASCAEAVCGEAESAGFRVERFEHSLRLSADDSDLRIQIQTDPRYQPFLTRAVSRGVLGYSMRVASLEDVFQGKLWAYLDASRRPSKRQKDLADIMRLTESHPALNSLLPSDVRGRFA